MSTNTDTSSTPDRSSVENNEKAATVDQPVEKNGPLPVGDNASYISEQTILAQKQGLKPAFYAKVQVLNAAMAEIGMGRYQYELFLSGGFGWFADNIWLQAVAIVMPAVQNELKTTKYVKLSSLALYVGLIVGAAFWGCSADIVGRRFAWNATLVIGGVFGCLVASAPNFGAFCFWIAMVGFGVGGNLPVDGTMFLEFLPGDKQYLLTLLSVWWAIGQVVASLIAWGFIARWGCSRAETDPPCAKADNMGWRYTYIVLGLLMIFFWVVRFFVLPVFESPKFLCSKGKDSEAVEVIHQIAKRNGVEVSITVEDLYNAAEPFLTPEEKLHPDDTGFSTWELIKNSMSELSGEHVSALFANRQLAYSTTLITFCYATLGLAYPLYNQFLGVFLAQKNAALSGSSSISDTYASYTYQAACGIPGSIVAAAMVELSRFGRKVSMAFFTAGTGAFMLGLTAANNMATVTALSCMAAFFENAFYGVIFGYAPELFPTPSRGTGDALCATAMRLTGFFAPVISIWSHAGDSPNGTLYAAAAIFLATAIAMLFLPVETRGKTAL